MGNTLKRQVKWWVLLLFLFFSVSYDGLGISPSNHKLFLKKVSLTVKPWRSNYRFSDILWYPEQSQIPEVEQIHWKRKSLECFRLVYLNIFTMLRQFWLYNCTCTGGAYTLPRDGPNHKHFMSILHGQESKIQNVPGLGSGFLYPPCGALFP